MQEFVTGIGAPFIPGRAFYELVKPETLRRNREVVLVDRMSGDMFTGLDARNYLGVPLDVESTVRPPTERKYSIFIQSTSPVRKLGAGQKILYEHKELRS
jgi:hypothetical protein